ncbi:MAG TPA: tRNA (cytidine(34)-2'-O)-methyltransferase [Burkholderiales bacterium]|nr:tRNA (cytidine(34)-2'-O)-methyltransferase [Burkholderiales bacterium]
MIDIVLYEPEIPPNTGNVMRIAANTGATLHLIQPLGFTLRDKQLQRAGMDYRNRAAVKLHESWIACRAFFAGRDMYALTTRGTRRYDTVRYTRSNVFVFGPETRGLPAEVLEAFPPDHRLRLPMLAQSRSLNLSNTVAIVVYEAWRQLGFPGGT